MMPMGPAPVISTSSPTMLKARAVCVALPNGSRMLAMSSVTASGSLNALLAGMTQVFGEAALPVHAHAHGVAAQVAPAGAAIAAIAAGEVAFARHAIAEREAAHFAAHVDDAAEVLVAHGHGHRDGLLRPGIPVVDVHVGAADRGLGDLDEHIVGADLGLRRCPSSRCRVALRS